MHACTREMNHQPDAGRGSRPRSGDRLEVTISTDGTWFTVHLDKRDNAGFELHLATDGDDVEATIHTRDTNSRAPGLRLYRDRPA